MSKLEQIMSGANPRAVEVGVELEADIRKAIRAVREEKLSFNVGGALFGMLCTNAIHRGLSREEFIAELEADSEEVWETLSQVYREQKQGAS